MKKHIKQSIALSVMPITLALVLAGCATSTPSHTPLTKTKEPTMPDKTTAAPEKPCDPTIAKVREFISEKAINTSQESWRTRLPHFPELSFAKDVLYTLVFQTSKGEIKIKLLTNTAPKHAANFIYLAELGFFDNLTFHRVIPGFMAQGGCPSGTGTGGPGYRFAGEFQGGPKHDKPGLLSMANAGPDTDGSQFFLTFVATPWLDGKHTIFGEVTSGHDTLKALEACGSASGKTSEKLVITKAVIETGKP